MARNTTLLERRSRDDAESSRLVRLGRGIAVVRSCRSWSRKRLAGRLGVTSKVLGYWERGVTQPPGEKLLELMLVLEVEPAELLAAGETRLPRRRRHGGAATLERRRTMSDETQVVPGPVDPLVGTEDPDLKSERLQDE